MNDGLSRYPMLRGYNGALLQYSSIGNEGVALGSVTTHKRTRSPCLSSCFMENWNTTGKVPPEKHFAEPLTFDLVQSRINCVINSLALNRNQ